MQTVRLPKRRQARFFKPAVQITPEIQRTPRKLSLSAWILLLFGSPNRQVAHVLLLGFLLFRAHYSEKAGNATTLIFSVIFLAATLAAFSGIVYSSVRRWNLLVYGRALRGKLAERKEQREIVYTRSGRAQVFLLYHHIFDLEDGLDPPTRVDVETGQYTGETVTDQEFELFFQSPDHRKNALPLDLMLLAETRIEGRKISLVHAADAWRWVWFPTLVWAVFGVLAALGLLWH